MNRARIWATLAFLGGAVSLSAQTATQNVTVEVTAISRISVSGAASLQINTAVAGSAPTQATHTSSSYSITTNETNQKITGSLSSNVATGLTLQVSLAAPSGGTSAGYRPLSTEAVNLVTGITKLNESSRTISFTLDATAAAGVVPSSTHILTYTVTAGP